MDGCSEDPQPAIDIIQVTVDSSTICGLSVCETLVYPQIVDDSVNIFHWMIVYSIVHGR